MYIDVCGWMNPAREKRGICPRWSERKHPTDAWMATTKTPNNQTSSQSLQVKSKPRERFSPVIDGFLYYATSHGIPI